MLVQLIVFKNYLSTSLTKSLIFHRYKQLVSQLKYITFVYSSVSFILCFNHIIFIIPLYYKIIHAAGIETKNFVKLRTMRGGILVATVTTCFVNLLIISMVCLILSHIYGPYLGDDEVQWLHSDDFRNELLASRTRDQI